MRTVFATLLFLSTFLIFACDDDKEADTMTNDPAGEMAGETMAGEAMAGEAMAGEAMADNIAWDESDSAQGELSGNPSSPTPITLSVGDNYIVGTSVPNTDEICIDNPDGSQAPYYPGHETYTDVITFTLPEGQTLTNIIVESLTVEAVHSACGIPMEMQLGAFTAIAASDQIDWNSDTFENFVKLPEAYPLIGAGFAKTEGTDLMSLYQAGFMFGPFSIEALAELPSNGTYSFRWKEGANHTTYRLNFVVSDQ